MPACPAGFLLGLSVARIRTIKPDFFTSEDIVNLSPTARLLYIALWCEADREGRMKWRPGTFKMRYLPRDEIAIEAVCNELISRGLVVLYGEGLAHIPTFREHQHVNPRETASVLPAPNEHAVDKARVSDACARVSDVQVGREGKEGKGREHASARVNGENQWWKTDQGIKAKGEAEGIATRPGESFAEYKARIFDHLNAKKKAAA